MHLGESSVSSPVAGRGANLGSFFFFFFFFQFYGGGIQLFGKLPPPSASEVWIR